MTFPIPSHYANWREWASRLIVSLLEQPQENNTSRVVTLTPNSTTTVVADAAISGRTVAVLAPRTASAAATSGVQQTVSLGALTLTHDSNPAGDRTFQVVLL